MSRSERISGQWQPAWLGTNWTDWVVIACMASKLREFRWNFSGNCESRNAGMWNGTRNGNKMQSAPEIRWTHMCALWGAHDYRHNHQVYSLAVYISGSGATAKFVHQSVSWRMAKYKVIDLTLSDSAWLWWWFHPSKESHPSVSVSSFCILHQVSEHQVSITSSSYYNRNYFTGLVHIHSNVQQSPE